MAEVDLSALDALISKLRRSREFIVSAAPAAAEAMQAALRATAAAGESPDGAAWAPRKKDGGRALANAANKIVVRAVGSVLLARIGWPESLHNDGTKTIPQRQILPSGEMPPAVATAVKDSLIESWKAAT